MLGEASGLRRGLAGQAPGRPGAIPAEQSQALGAQPELRWPGLTPRPSSGWAGQAWEGEVVLEAEVTAVWP